MTPEIAPRTVASGSRAQASRTRTLLIDCLVAVLAVAIYAPAVGGPFVWDDRLLLETPQIAQLEPLDVYLRQPFWQVPDPASYPAGARGAYYRPLTTLSLALDRSIHGDNASGFHLLGLVLHALNSALVASLARRLGAGLGAAFVGALCFAWFPRSTEAVAWISGRTDVLATTFSLLALLLTFGSWPARRWLAAGCILLGAFSKEVALATAVGVLFWEWSSPKSPPPRRPWLRLVPTGIACAIYLVLRISALGGSADASRLALTSRALASLEAVARYAIMLVDGWQPRLQIGYLAGPEPWLAALGFLLLPVPFVLLRSRRCNVRESALLVVCFGALSVVLHVVPIQGMVVAADRFLYLPVAVLGALGAAWMSRASAWLPPALGLALALSYAPATWGRAGVWGDDIAFWGTAVSEQSPALDAHARLGFGNLLAEHGMYDAAVEQYAKAQPGDAHSWALCQYNRAGLLATNGEFDRAIVVLEQAQRRAPTVSQLERLALLHANALRGPRAQELVRAYAARVRDPERVHALAAKVDGILMRMPQLNRPRVTLSEQLAQARDYEELGLFRLAMAQLVSLLSHPDLTSGHLLGIYSLALEHGTPEQLQAVHARLRTLRVAYPRAYDQVVLERMQRITRLRQWLSAGAD